MAIFLLCEIFEYFLIWEKNYIKYSLNDAIQHNYLSIMSLCQLPYFFLTNHQIFKKNDKSKSDRRYFLFKSDFDFLHKNCAFRNLSISIPNQFTIRINITMVNLTLTIIPTMSTCISLIILLILQLMRIGRQLTLSLIQFMSYLTTQSFDVLRQNLAR